MLSPDQPRVASPDTLGKDEMPRQKVMLAEADTDARYRSKGCRPATDGLQPLDAIDDFEPLSPCSVPPPMVDRGPSLRRSRTSVDSASSSSLLDSPEGVFALPSQAASARPTEHKSQVTPYTSYEAPQAPLTARYLTVSSVLSRSGAALPLQQHPDTRHHQATAKTHRRRSYKRALKGSPAHSATSAAGPRSSTSSNEGWKKKRASNGSALEALGALFLQRDSSGKVSNLSFLRHSAGQGEATTKRDKTFKYGLTSVSRAWLEGITGPSKVGIQMPDENGMGHTIAQRRARKITLEGEGGQRRVGTKSNQPTFEVAVTHPSYPSNLSPQTASSTPPPAPKLRGMMGDELTPPPLDYESQPFAHQAPLTEPSGIYGPGSAFSWIEPPELPPSPIGMPGAWAIGSGVWNRDRLEEGALLLPPPLLDDQGSDQKSFEGLLGVRRMREQERARKQLEKLKARNRPAHKVGMLTAFSNFVKAAHAADKATRSTNARVQLKRRHTEPADAVVNVDDSVPTADRDKNVVAAPMSRSGSLTRASMDSSGRQLETVYEARSPAFAERSESSQEEEDGDDDDESTGDSPALSYRRASTDEARPKRRLLPVHLSSADDADLLSRSIDNASVTPHSLTYRSPSEPSTPRIGPTMLSLPPSPWTPYGGARSGAQLPYHFHLGMTPVVGPPGTPRLMPAMLEVAPSPFSNLGGMTPLMRSPRAHTMMATSGSSATAPSPLALTPHDSPVQIATRPSSARRRKTTQAVPMHEARLTPSTSMSMMETDQLTPKKPGRVYSKDGPKEREKEHVNTTPSPRKRSFLLWFLFGDLGLGTRSTIAAKAAGSPPPTIAKRYSQAYVLCLSVAAHVYGFSVFVLAHLVDLGYRIAEFLSMAFWFLRWVMLNLTGQTVLARCAVDAYRVVAREWETVSKEDHERKGIKAGKAKPGYKVETYRGLSRWQVMKGMIELVCLQDVTRQRYLEEGAGLEELKGWQRRRSERLSESNEPGQIDLGVMRAADRRAKDDKITKRVQDDDAEEEDESDSESSDDDMVVTHRGADILEFTKTPKVEHHGYFSPEDGEMPDVVRPGRHAKRSMSGSSMGPHEPATRHLVKMIKWASRLAISAYGLHVTLVDLPATFTPSGDRFSRQTFAHLSRLHHEDVLHADIQTLNSDDYSPTFYLVRDLSRRVVVVSVRGTQSLQDIIVDLEMVTEQVKLHNEDIEKEPDEALYCHAGILRAAKALIARDSTLFRTLNEALREHPDFGVVFTGHSLGGAIASAVVLLLSRFETAHKQNSTTTRSDALPDWPADDDDAEPGQWVTHDRSGLPAGRPIRAITFAHPATVSANLAARAGRGKTPLVLSVVLGHDIIPRCGHGQARELRRVLGALSRVRRRKETRTDGRRGSVSSIETNQDDGDDDFDARVHIVTSWWTWRKIRKRGKAASRQEQMKAQRIEEELWYLRCDVESDLYSAVKRRSGLGGQSGTKDDAEAEEKLGNVDRMDDQEGNVDEGARPTASRKALPIPPSPWMGPSQRAKAPLHQLTSRRQALDAITLANEESISKSAGVLVPAGRSIWIYEGRLYKITSPLSFFGLPDFHPRMFSEHFPSAYEDWLEKL